MFKRKREKGQTMFYKTLHNKPNSKQNTNPTKVQGEYMYTHNSSTLVLSYYYELGPEHPDFPMLTVPKLVPFD